MKQTLLVTWESTLHDPKARRKISHQARSGNRLISWFRTPAPWLGCFTEATWIYTGARTIKLTWQPSHINRKLHLKSSLMVIHTHTRAHTRAHIHTNTRTHTKQSAPTPVPADWSGLARVREGGGLEAGGLEGWRTGGKGQRNHFVFAHPLTEPF